MPIRNVPLAVAVTGLLIGCSGSDTSDSTVASNGTTPTTESDGSSPPRTTIAIDDTATDDTATDEAATSSSMTTAPESTAETTTTDPTAPTTTTAATITAPSTDNAPASTVAGGDVIDLSFVIPSGSFVATAPGDVIVLGTDGDLELRPRLVGTTDDPAIPLVDNADPREPVEEGSGPNVIDDVAGFANGSLVYGDCCEPASGNVYALTGPDAEPIAISGGYDPGLSPNGERLVTANSFLVTVTSVDDGAGSALSLNQGDDGRFLDVFDVQWTTDSEIALISRSRDDELLLTTFDADTFTETRSIPLAAAANVDDVNAVNFAGYGPDGTVAVSFRGEEQTTIRFFEPGSLTESDDTRTLPATVSSVELVPGDLGLTWVDDEVLYYLAPGQFEATPLAFDVLAAWSLDPT